MIVVDVVTKRKEGAVPSSKSSIDCIVGGGVAERPFPLSLPFPSFPRNYSGKSGDCGGCSSG